MSIVNNSAFKFRNPVGNVGQQSPVWNAGSINSINVDTDTVQNGDQLYYNQASRMWVTGIIPTNITATGTAANPSYSFQSSTGTGMYLDGANAIGFATNGVERLSISTTAIESQLPIYAATGSTGAANPSYSFHSSTGTGMYLDGANAIGFATNGVERLSISTTAIESQLPVYTSTGATGAPSYSFVGDPDTGIYSSGANSIGFVTNSVQRLGINTLNVTSTLPYASPYATAAGADSGIILSTGVQVMVLTAGAETGPYALTGPAGIAGQILYVRNDSGQATTGGLVVTAAGGAVFVHNGTSWLKVSDS